MRDTSCYRQSNLFVVLCSNDELLARKPPITVDFCLLAVRPKSARQGYLSVQYVTCH